LEKPWRSRSTLQFGQRPFAQLAMLKFAGNMLYAQRHLVECCFSKLKQFRHVATIWVLRPRSKMAAVKHQPNVSSGEIPAAWGQRPRAPSAAEAIGALLDDD